MENRTVHHCPVLNERCLTVVNAGWLAGFTGGVAENPVFVTIRIEDENVLGQGNWEQ